MRKDTILDYFSFIHFILFLSVSLYILSAAPAVAVAAAVVVVVLVHISPDQYFIVIIMAINVSCNDYK